MLGFFSPGQNGEGSEADGITSSTTSLLNITKELTSATEICCSQFKIILHLLLIHTCVHKLITL